MKKSKLHNLITQIKVEQNKCNVYPTRIGINYNINALAEIRGISPEAAAVEILKSLKGPQGK